MKDEFDAVVVGGGPCGSFSAFTMARHGMNVAVCEEHREIGVPTHCAGHLSLSGLTRLDLHLPSSIVENMFKRAVLYSPNGNELSVGSDSPATCVVNRGLFDKYLSDLAKKAGAQYLLESRAESFVTDSGFIRGIAIRKREAKQTLTSNLVVDAEGCSSALLRRTGLQTLDRSMIVNAVQTEVDRIDNVDINNVELYLGRKYAPGFFAWIIPKRDDSAKIGLATNVGNPREYLYRFTQKHPVASKKLRKSKITSLCYHPISLGGAIPKTYSNGLLTAGDAASQVKATTGGGIIFGLLCSKIAGKVAYEALQSHDFSEVFLSRYQSKWKRQIGFDLAVMRQIRKWLNRLSDDRIDRIIELCAKSGIDTVLEDVGDLDFQGTSLIRMIRRPLTLVVALYFAFSAFVSST
ncbi:MAG: NAD(P)/FAD-dependent oxidoreductase [Candidatus Bathyarchaeota archaeon]|nr:MAG: NAD(P)/FAD-dependent oxidoreductase [Candidatus Bathyarchaeota archaeon]